MSENLRIINFSKIEKKWQKKWEESGVFVSKEKKGTKKFYICEMYPYPSGYGLHMGHAFNYTIGDIQARLRRMQGFNVLYPMGFDSFGLPAENAAIKEKSHPKKFTEEAIKNYIRQMKELGLSYDWSRKVESHSPEYYKWDQWIFLKMLEKGLAYRKKAPVNFCSKCNTVLANEQVVNGRCWRHEDVEVEIRHLEQWFLKITDYAEELYNGIDKLDDWPDLIKKMQKNWIGKSEGVEIDFEINGDKWKVFTTRPDTLFGVTFLVVSAQHPELMSLVSDKQLKDVQKFLKKIKSTKEEDMDKLGKEGVFTGSYAKHPLTGEKIPVWTGNFVVADYGSGMVMADAHDQRDLEFAQKYKIPLIEVIRPKDGNSRDPNTSREAYTGYGVLVNSREFSGLQSDEAMEHILIALKKVGKGRKVTRYKLRDWLISRQRFWGTPIPIIYCNDCGIVPVSEKNLPVILPEEIIFSDTENPLKNYRKFVEVNCPKCSGLARRETDTMDTFVNSSWYYLRYADSKNKKEIFDKEKTKYWMPLDIYIGGKEHATLHLIYSRFYTKFFRDLGLLNFDEPFKKLFNQGMLHANDGRKMSKSLGNIILPEQISKRYGIDSARLFLVSLASPDKDINWSDEGIEGSLRFIVRIIDFSDEFSGKGKNVKMNSLQESKFNRLIKEYTEDLEKFRYNLAVIKLREIFTILEQGCSKKDLAIFLKLLSAICPHIAEELWNKLGNKKLICVDKWPSYDESKIDVKLEEQEKRFEKTIEDIKNVLKILEEKGKTGKKVYLYVIPNELVLFNELKINSLIGKEVKVYAVNDSKKYDPEGKSKKVIPGRPGIYIE